MFRWILKQIQKLNDERFVDSLEETRKRNQIFAFLFLGFLHPFYILIDRTMYPDIWMNWNFLGVRLLVTGSTLIILSKKAWRESKGLFYIPTLSLFLGIPLMLNSYKFDQLAAGYSGIGLVMFGFSLVSTLSLRKYIALVTSIYAFCFQIWIVHPPLSFESWITDGGFSNFTVSFLASTAFYWFKLNLWHNNYVLMEALQEKSEAFETQAIEVKSILDHVPQEVCLIRLAADGQTLELDEHRSLAFTKSALASGILDPVQLLFERTDLSADTIKSIEWILRASLNEDILQWELNLHNLPRELRAGSGERLRQIEIDWSVVPDIDGKVAKILVLLKDVGEIRQLQEDVAKRNADARLLFELIQNNPKKLGEFLAIAETMLEDASAHKFLSREIVKEIFRNVHTLKGMARGYQLNELIQHLHSIEESLSAKAGHDFPMTMKQLPSFLSAREALKAYQILFQKIYNRQSTHQYLSVDPRAVKDLCRKLEYEGNFEKDSASYSLLSQIMSMFATRLDRIIIDELSMLSRLAEGMGKLPPLVKMDELDLDLRDEDKVLLRTVFVHLFRNTVDHGIEMPEDRERLSKNPQGRIDIHIAEVDSYYRLDYRDDGRGLNLPMIRERALALGLASRISNIPICRLPNLSSCRTFRLRELSMRYQDEGQEWMRSSPS